MPVHLIFSEIRVRNLSRSVRYYRALGLVPKAKGSTESGTRFVFLWDKRTRQVVQLWHFPPRVAKLYRPFRSVRGYDHGLAFTTVRADALLRRLARVGGKTKRSVMIGDVRMTTVTDPDGHLLEILDRPRGGMGDRRRPPLLNLAFANRPS